MISSNDQQPPVIPHQRPSTPLQPPLNHPLRMPNPNLRQLPQPRTELLPPIPPNTPTTTQLPRPRTSPHLCRGVTTRCTLPGASCARPIPHARSTNRLALRPRPCTRNNSLNNTVAGAHTRTTRSCSTRTRVYTRITRARHDQPCVRVRARAHRARHRVCMCLRRIRSTRDRACVRTICSRLSHTSARGCYWTFRRRNTRPRLNSTSIGNDTRPGTRGGHPRCSCR
jgi:hypothetical protein